MFDADLIGPFLDVARSTIRCEIVMLAWRRQVVPLSPTERQKFDEPWFMYMHRNVARTLCMFRRLMMEEEFCNVVEVDGDGVTDGDMLEAAEQMEGADQVDDNDELSDDTLLQAETLTSGVEVVWCPDTVLELFNWLRNYDVN